MMVSYSKIISILQVSQILKWKVQYPLWRMIASAGTDVPRFCYAGSHFAALLEMLGQKEDTFWRFMFYQVILLKFSQNVPKYLIKSKTRSFVPGLITSQSPIVCMTIGFIDLVEMRSGLVSLFALKYT